LENTVKDHTVNPTNGKIRFLQQIFM